MGNKQAFETHTRPSILCENFQKSYFAREKYFAIKEFHF
jgi:hypothetical protein